MDAGIRFGIGEPIDLQELADFWQRAWGAPPPAGYDGVLSRSLTHVVARQGSRLIGFVNVAWDGGIHAFMLDTAVDPEFRRHGIATQLVQIAAKAARDRNMHWLHVDFEPQLEGFYRACGFTPTRAGLMRLAP